MSLNLAAGSLLLARRRKRYHYWTPRGRRADVASGGRKAKSHGHTNAALGARTSPFISFWYVGGVADGVRRLLKEHEQAAEQAARGSGAEPPRVRVCWTTSQLPNGVLAEGGPRSGGGGGGTSQRY